MIKNFKDDDMRKICKKRNFFWNKPKEQAGVGIVNDGQYPLKINKKMQKEVDSNKKALPKTHQKRIKKELVDNNTPIQEEAQKTQVTEITEVERLKKQQEARKIYQIEYQKNYNRKHPRQKFTEENLDNIDILDKPEEKKKLEKDDDVDKV